MKKYHNLRTICAQILAPFGGVYLILYLLMHTIVCLVFKPYHKIYNKTLTRLELLWLIKSLEKCACPPPHSGLITCANPHNKCLLQVGTFLGEKHRPPLFWPSAKGWSNYAKCLLQLQNIFFDSICLLELQTILFV